MKYLLASILALTFLTGPVARTKQIQIPARAADIDPDTLVCGGVDLIMYVYFGIPQELCGEYEQP